MSSYTRDISSTGGVSHYMAMRIALKYAHRTPTWRELVAEFGMSRATAFRWIRGLKDAKGEQ